MKTLILNANSDKKVNTIIVNRVKKLSQKYKNHFSFDYLYKEGKDYPKMMSVGLHCRIIGRPGRIVGLENLYNM